MAIKPEQIVQDMCKTELNGADIRAICKARGFSFVNADSPSVFENFFISDIGLQEAYASLSRKDIAMLHFLTLIKKPVDITLFERLMDHPVGWRSTFNQQYANVFKYVKTHLIRKGVLAFAPDPHQFGKKTKLERLRFTFPTQFHPHLPGLFASTRKTAKSGAFNAACIREKLKQIINPAQSDRTVGFNLFLHAGTLQMGDQEFSMAAFRKWQHKKWSMSQNLPLEYPMRPDKSVCPMVALRHAFSTLEPDEWVNPDEFKLVIDIFCQKKDDFDAHDICKHGWLSGCLERLDVDRKPWYRLAHEENWRPKSPSYAEYMKIDREGNIQVNLETITLPCLETLSQISKFTVKDGRLLASPNRVRLGRMLHALENDPFTNWLIKSSRPFGAAFSCMKKRWGKQIVHTDLLIAKVKNIGLKMTLKAKFKDGNVIFLPNDFIAFPKNLNDRIQSIVIQNGFAVKTVTSSKQDPL